MLGWALGLIRKNKPALLQEHQLSGSSSVDAIARCLSEYFQKQFEFSDIIMLQTGHVVRREFHFVACRCKTSVLFSWILCCGTVHHQLDIVVIRNKGLSSKKKISMHFNLVHLGVVRTI